MKSKLSPFLVGSFVLGGLALVTIGLLSFRSLHLFSRPGRFVAYFNESVQGLDIGSPVKLRGVRVGRVATIQVQHNSKTGRSQVAVIAELDKSGISDPAGQKIEVEDPATLQRLIDEGLRAKIDLIGITGLQYVELDFVDPMEFPAPPRDSESESPVVPTLRSGMSEMVANLSKIANNLNKVDFAGLSSELQTLFASVNRQVRDVDLKQMVAKVTAAAESIGSMASSQEMKGVFTNLNRTAIDVQGLVAKLDVQIDPLQADLSRTLHSFHDAAESIHKLLSPQSGLSEEAVRTLQRIAETAESVQRLAEFLERNPSVLLMGKKRPYKEP